VALSTRYLALALAGLLWGTTFSISKLILGVINVVALITMRTIFAMVALLLYLSATKKLRKIGPMFKANKKWMFIIGICFFASPYIVQYTAIEFGLVSTFIQAVLLNLQSFFVIIVNLAYFKKKAPRLVILGACIAFIGALLINLKPGIDVFSQNSTIWGILITAVACFLWACFTAFSKPICAKEGSDPIVFNTIIVIIATCVLLPFGIFTPGGFVNLPSLSSLGWIGLIWLGSVCVGITYVLWFYGLQEIESSRVVVFVYLEPIVAGLMVLVLPQLNETLSYYSIIGMVLCFLGVYIAQIERKNHGLERQVRAVQSDGDPGA